MSDRRRKRNRYDRADKSDRGGGTEDKKESDVDESSPVIQMFKCFQKQLDQRHDKYERIVKLNRDITIESKRAIFMLQRVTVAGDCSDIFQQVDEKLLAVEKTKFLEIAKEIEQEDPFQFLRAYSSGLQEYIEALSFNYFLKNNSLIKLEDVQARLSFKRESSEKTVDSASDGQVKDANPDIKDPIMDVKDTNLDNVKVTNTDGINCSEVPIEMDTTDSDLSVYIPNSEYILGVADLTGEMMRRAINSVGSGDLERPFEICSFLREIESAYSSLGNANREVNRKLHVLRQSLRKVETACYTLRVRGSEVPKHMLIDMISKTNINQYSMDDSVVTEDD
ncbi:hypothetical protein ACF0H5_001966 [Mactra antiquata]